MAARVSDVLKIVFALFLPPLGVFLERGLNRDFLINLLLTIFGYIPGVIHALFLLIKVPIIHPMHNHPGGGDTMRSTEYVSRKQY